MLSQIAVVQYLRKYAGDGQDFYLDGRKKNRTGRNLSPMGLITGFLRYSKLPKMIWILFDREFLEKIWKSSRVPLHYRVSLLRCNNNNYINICPPPICQEHEKSHGYKHGHMR